MIKEDLILIGGGGHYRILCQVIVNGIMDIGKIEFSNEIAITLNDVAIPEFSFIKANSIFKD